MTNLEITLNDNTIIPQVGFGVWKLPDNRAPDIVGHALRTGYRHIDTAHAYNNEGGVGRAIREAGIPRSQIFVTTKLWNMFHGRDETVRAFEGSMDRLGLDYLDMFLIHWPVPMEGRYVDTWRAMIELRDKGRIRTIGVSNFDPDHLQRLVDETGIVPAVNQIELHPNFQQRHAREIHDRLGIKIQCWSPLGQGNIMENPDLVAIATKHGVSVSQVVLRWHIEQSFIVIPRSKSPAHIDENIDVGRFSLDAKEMSTIAGLDNPDGRIGPVPTELGVVPLPAKT